MHRTEFCNKLRAEGFIVRPLWQGKTEDPEGPRFDLTCYEVRTPYRNPFTNMIVRQLPGGGISVFFESMTIRVEDDIKHLRQLAAQSAEVA